MSLTPRHELSPALHEAAESVCIYKLTDGFCRPRDNPGCKCWATAQQAQEATGLSYSAVSWIFKHIPQIEEQAKKEQT